MTFCICVQSLFWQYFARWKTFWNLTLKYQLEMNDCRTEYIHTSSCSKYSPERQRNINPLLKIDPNSWVCTPVWATLAKNYSDPLFFIYLFSRNEWARGCLSVTWLGSRKLELESIKRSIVDFGLFIKFVDSKKNTIKTPAELNNKNEKTSKELDINSKEWPCTFLSEEIEGGFCTEFTNKQETPPFAVRSASIII